MRPSKALRGGHRQIVIDYSDDDRTTTRLTAPINDASYREGPASGLENSQASLNKRLASVAGLDDSSQTNSKSLCVRKGHEQDASHDNARALKRSLGTPAPRASESAPTDFRFLFNTNATEQEPVAESEESEPLGASLESFDEGEYRWFRTSVTRGADLVNGEAWVSKFQRKLAESPAENLAQRNRLVRDMAKHGPPGKKVRLASGQDVIFWFNVGPPGPTRNRVYVTESRCPHQGVCLLSSELAEVEDLNTGIKSATIRCPRHNKAFDVKTGKSAGNSEVLQTFPCRFAHGHWYVGIEIDVDQDKLPVDCVLAPTTPSRHLQFPLVAAAEPVTEVKSGKPNSPQRRCLTSRKSHSRSQ